MNLIIEQINSAGGAFVKFALPMMVQSSFLIVILLVLDLVLRKKVRAVFRYWLWMLILLKLVLPSSLSSPVSLGYLLPLPGLQPATLSTQQAEQAADVIAGTIVQEPIEVTEVIPEKYQIPEAQISKPWVDGQADLQVAAELVVPMTWQGAVFGLWLFVLVVLVLLLLQRAVFVAGLVKQAKVANELMKDTLKQCCKDMSVSGGIGLKVSPNATSPAVCGLFRPVILVPAGIGTDLGKEGLMAILLHELAHIKKGDLWVNLVQTILQIVYFYNPFLWLANAVIRRVREQAVDEMVLVAMGEKANDYPQTLLEVAKAAFRKPALSLRLIGVVESKSALAGRVKHILNRPIPKTAKLGILGLIAVVVFGIALLPMSADPGPPGFIVKGKVTDAQTGQSVVGAKVGDNKEYNNGKFSTITNSNGDYKYKTWYEEHGTTAEADGYKQQLKGFNTKLFGSEKEKIINFELVPGTTLPSVVTVEPVGVDSDGDGLSDFQEVHKYLTDPKKKDSDGDGVEDGGWDERREYSYSVRTVVRYMPPFDEKALNDDFQDARVLSRSDDFIEIEVVHYPFSTAGDEMRENPNWQKDYAKMKEYIKPGITTNWDQKMRKDLLAQLKADGVDVSKLTDKEVVKKVSRWALNRAKSLDKVFTTYYVHFPKGRPEVYPGLEEAFESEFKRDSENYDWTIDEHFDYEVLGKGMYYNRTRGSCTSTGVYLTTVLRAVGIPTRMIMVIPVIDATNPGQMQLVKNGITHNEVRAKALVGLGRSGKGFTDHVFNEVYIGNRWHRLNYTKLGQPILDIHCFGLHTHLYTFNDLSEAELAPAWGYRYGRGIKDDIFGHSNPYTTLELSDLFGKYCKIDNPPFSTTQLASGELPNIFIMSPSRTRDSRFSIWEEVLARVKDATHNKTGREHKKQDYDDIFGEVHIRKPGDYLVMLFSLDTKERIPAEYEDLLPKPWSEIEQALGKGQTVEFAGQARDMNIILLAAQKREQLKQLIQQTKLLKIGRESSETTIVTSGYKAKLANGVTVELVELLRWRDGGSIGFVFKDIEGKVLQFCLNAKVKSKYQGYFFIGATHAEKQGAERIEKKSPEEKELLSILRFWVDSNFTEQQQKVLFDSLPTELDRKEFDAKTILRLLKRYPEIKSAEQVERGKIDYCSVTVEEGVGFEDIIVGNPKCDREYIKLKLGKPEEDLRDNQTNGWWLSYRKKYGLDFWFNAKNVLREIRLNDKFKGSLTSGISISSAKEDVFGIYGKPIAERTVDNLKERLDGKIVHKSDRILYKGRHSEISKIYYRQNSLLFWFEGDEINQIVVFPKKQQPAEQVEGEDEKVEQGNSGTVEKSELISGREVQWVDAESGEVLFNLDDIVRFDWDKQIFELTRPAAMDFMAELGSVGVQGRKFIVRDGLKVVYEGTLVTSISSFSFFGPVIRDPILPDDIKPPLFKIGGGYPTDFKRGDTRFSERLKRALQRAGVLGENDSHLRDVKFRIIDEDTGEPLKNRELNICKFVYFKLKPGAPSPYLDKKASWYITSVITDDNGGFILDLSSIDTTDIVVEPGKPYNIVRFGRSSDLRHIKSNDHIRVVQFKPGTTQVVSNMIYDLKRKMVRIISISGGTEELPFQEVLLYAKRIKKSLEKPAEQVENTEAALGGAEQSVDDSVPKVVKMAPANGSEMALFTELMVTFDRPMEPGPIRISEVGGDELFGRNKDIAAVEDYVVYDANAYQFTIPLILPSNWNGVFAIGGFKSAEGIEAEPITLKYSTLRKRFSDDLLARFEKSLNSGPLKELLADIKAARSKIKSLSETVYTDYNYGDRRKRTTKAVFKMQGDKQFFADISETMKIPFFIGSDGRNCWFYNGREGDEKLIVTDFDTIDKKTVSICDAFGLSRKSIESAIAEYKLEYVGTETLDGRKCYKVRSWWIDLHKHYTSCRINTWWFDGEDFLPVQIKSYYGKNQSLFRFVYDIINQPIDDQEFGYNFVKTVEPTETEPLGEGYDRRYIKIVDGSAFARMRVRWGKRGSKGSSSSGLN